MSRPFILFANLKFCYVYVVISSEEISGNMLPVLSRRVTKPEPINADMFITLQYVTVKIKIAETIIFPTVTYGSESWTVRKKGRKKIVAFELRMWRRILRVPWTEKKTNLSVLEDVKPKRSLEATIFRLKLRYFGHVMRTKRSLEQNIKLGQVAGNRRQGKPRTR